MCRDCELAWASGIFEGEGCIHLGPNGIVLTVRMTDEDILHRLKFITGQGNVTGPHQWDTNRKPIYSWHVTNHHVCVSVLQRMEPWLGERRTAKFHECLAEVATWEKAPGPPKPRRKAGSTF